MNKILGLILLVSLIPVLAIAQSFPEAVFILDGSGSMQGDAGGQTKMEAAKTVLTQVLGELPAEVKVGLVAYGHRRPKDCTDIEIIVPAGSSDRDAVLAGVAAIQPNGMTPIASTVSRVAATLKGRKAETTIILVSDGKETCGYDPCATVKKLKEAGVNFIMHVVGFDVTDEERVQLDCIAEAGGGRYFGATDTAALAAALEAVSEEIEQKVEKAKSKTVKKATGLGKLRIVMPESAIQSLGGFRVSRKKDGKQIKQAEFTGPDTTHPLMSGEYQLTLLFANTNYKPPTEFPAGDFTINKGEITEVAFGDIVFNKADELNDVSVSSMIITDNVGGEEVLKIEPGNNDYYLFRPKALPAGTYDVSIHYYRSPASTLIAQGVSVSEGKETCVTLDSGIVLQKPSEPGVEGWDLIQSGFVEPLLSVRRGWDNQEPMWRQFIIPSGTYDLNILMKGMDEPLPVAEGIEIKQGETLKFDTGL